MSLYKQIRFNETGGRPRAFNSPGEMWDKAKEYFAWCESNPIDETKLFSFQGEISSGKAPHMRAMTKAGLCSFLNIGISTLKDYNKKEEYSAVIDAIEQVMYEQKFSGAAAGMLKENIIARDLGIIDKDDDKVTVTNNIMPVPVADSVESWEEAAQKNQEALLKHE